jgi:hypothetical protein
LPIGRGMPERRTTTAVEWRGGRPRHSPHGII